MQQSARAGHGAPEAVESAQFAGSDAKTKADVHFLLAKLAERFDFQLVTVPLRPGEAYVRDEDFMAQFEALNEELVALNIAGRELEQTIAENVTRLLDA